MGGIVVGVDGSAAARMATAWAAEEAVRREVELHVVHVWHAAFPTGPFDVEPFGPAPYEEAAACLVDAAVREVEATVPGVRADRLLVHGRVRPALLELARSAQLLVVGARGDGVAARALGSVTQYAVQCAHPPVVVVPAIRPTGAGIVVGVDGSAASRAALRAALDVARHRDVPVRAALVWSLLTPYGAGGPCGPDPAYGQPDAERAVEQLVDDVVADPADRRRVSAVALWDFPERALMAEAARSELLVLGTRGHGRWAGRMSWSVSGALVERASVPTMVVHAA